MTAVLLGCVGVLLIILIAIIAALMIHTQRQYEHLSRRCSALAKEVAAARRIRHERTSPGTGSLPVQGDTGVTWRVAGHPPTAPIRSAGRHSAI